MCVRPWRYGADLSSSISTVSEQNWTSVFFSCFFFFCNGSKIAFFLRFLWIAFLFDSVPVFSLNLW